MGKWSKGIGIILTTLILLASQATLVLARAGGGRGGSLGGSAGRSFSSGSFSGGSFSGGFSGRSYTGGFFPFPFPFFMGGTGYSGGSIFGGLFGFLFILLILYLVFKAMRVSRTWRGGSFGGGRGGNFGGGHGYFGGGRRSKYGGGAPFGGKQDTWRPRDSWQPQDSWQGDSLHSSPIDISGRPITNADNLRRFAQAISFTRDNMLYYAQTFPRWDRPYLIGRIRQVFFWFQDAWSRQDLSEAPEYLAPDLTAKYRSDLERMRARGERNLIKEPVLNQGDIEFIDSDLNEENERFVVMLSASLLDYTIDASGRTIAGDAERRLYFTEFWEFGWQDNKWVLTRIFQEDALELAQIAREHN